MTVREYLNKIGRADVTFIVQHTVKDKFTPFYHSEYKTTCIQFSTEWLREQIADTHIVIVADHPPIDTTGGWHNRYKGGFLRCAMVTTEADLITHYGEAQGRDMIAYYDREVRAQMRQKGM